jgi:hypothetical protein
MTEPSLLDAMTTCGLAGESWGRWRVVAKCLDGHPLTAAELDVYQQCTGRAVPPSAPPAEFYAICGRRSGKSRFAGALAARAASRRYAALAPGERAVIGLAAADREQARILYGYAAASFTSAVARGVQALRALVQRETRWSLDLKSGVSVEVHTSHFGRIRGRTYALAVADELSFWQAEDGSNPASEVLAAIRPSLVTLGGQLIGISSPFGKAGPLWDLYQRAFGKDDPRVLVWKAATRTMNPSIPQGVVDAALARDEESARAEWLGEFRDDQAALITDSGLARVVRPTTPAEETTWPVFTGTPLIFLDAASGSGGDSFTAALAVSASDGAGHPIAHVLEVHECRAPFNPAQVVDELGASCAELGIRQVHGDSFALGWLAAMLRGVGLEYRVSPLTKSQLYLELLVLINAGRVSLPNDPRLLRQLMGLIRRPTGSGRESVDHAARAGARDDVANAAAGAAVLVDRQARRPPLRVW